MNGAHPTFQSLAVYNYRLFVAGHAVSEIGTWMQKVGQAWLVLELSSSGLWLGVATALQHLPVLLLGPWSGLIADRVDKRRLLIVVHGIAGLLALVLGVVTATGAVSLWMVLALALGLGIATALERPARLSFVVEMVGAANLPNAYALTNIVGNAGKMVGPASAGVLIALFGLASSFLVNALTYVVVIVSLAKLRRGELRPVDRLPRGSGQLREGIRYVRDTPVLLGPLILMSIAGLLAYEWSVTLPLLARDVFEGGAQVFGLMYSAMGVGAVLGGLVVATRMIASAAHLLKMALVFGLLVLAVAASPNLTVVLVVLLVTGGASIAFRTVAMSLIQLQTAPQFRGRVIALLVVATAGTTPIGGPLIGWIAETAGARAATALGGAATILTAIGTWVYLRRHSFVGPRLTSVVPLSTHPLPNPPSRS